METLAEQLAGQRRRSAARRTAEQQAAIAAGVDLVRASGITERAPAPGAHAPDFTLPNVRGEEIRLGDLLGRGPVVLAFYRGGW